MREEGKTMLFRDRKEAGRFLAQVPRKLLGVDPHGLGKPSR